MNGVCNGIFWSRPLGPSKGQIFNFNYRVNFKDFYTKLCVCVLTNDKYTTYEKGFSFKHKGHAPGVELWGAWGSKGVKRLFFFRTMSCSILN